MSFALDAEKYHPDIMDAIDEVQSVSDFDMHTVEGATPESLDVQFHTFGSSRAYLHVETNGDSDNELSGDPAIVEVRIDDTDYDHHTIAGALARITAYFSRAKWA